MEIDRLLRLLECQGTRTAHWPADARQALPELLRTDPAGRAAWAEATLLDSLLDEATPPPLDATLAAQIVARTQGSLAMFLLAASPNALWRTALVLLLPTLLGLALGVALPQPFESTDATSAEEWTMLAYGPQLNGEIAE